MTTLISLILGYLLGSIPFGLVLTRLAGTEDIRTIGSGNIGATNVLRTGRKGLAAGTLLMDALKGTAAVLIGQWLGGPEAAIAGGLAAFLGHLFPVWLKFNGGKGVATFLGILLGLSWPMLLVAAGIWLAVAFLTKYSSLSALVMSAAMPVLFLITGKHGFAALFLVLSALLWWKHRLNIERLRAGTEGRIGQKG